MRITIIFFLVFLYFNLAVSGQSSYIRRNSIDYILKDTVNYIYLNGHIIDDKSSKGIEYSAIWIKGKTIGVMSDDYGYFKFNIPIKYINDSLCVSVLGYKQQTLSIKDLSKSKNITIRLSQSQIKLKEVVIDDTNPLQILQKVLRKQDNSIPSKAYLFNGFYRETTKINNTYTALLEAAFTSYRRKIKNKTEKNIALTRIDALRYTMNYNQNKRDWYDFDNYLYQLDLWTENYTKKKFLDVNESVFTKCITINDSTKEQYLILFYYNTDHDEYTGEITINKDNYYIESYHIQSKSYKPEAPGELSYDKKGNTFKPTNLTLEFDFIELKNHIYINRIRDIRNCIYVDSVTGKISENIETSREYIVDKIQNKKKNPISSKDKMFYTTPLEYQGIKYDSVFWENYTFYSNVELDQKIKNDLEKETPLNLQFKNSQLANLLPKLRNTKSQKAFNSVWDDFLSNPNIYIKNYEEFETFADSLETNKEFEKARKIRKYLVDEYYNYPWSYLYLADNYFETNNLYSAAENYKLFLNKMKKPYKNLNEIRGIVKNKLKYIEKK